MLPNPIDAAIAELARPGRLATALEHAFDGVPRRLAFAAFRCGPEWTSAGVSDAGRAGRDVSPLPMPAGCLAKLLTATLATRLLARSRVDLDMRADALLPFDSTAGFEAVTLRQLLEHTHGIDGSLIERAPLRGGFIDVPELVRSVAAAPAMVAPGALYSYGNVGAWLVAAALERLANRPYPELLRDELLAPLGIDTAKLAARRDGICPATGRGLALTAVDWLRFLESAMANRAQWPSRAGGDVETRPITPLPGWNPLERGVFLGWKYHGGGWFGHQSAWPDASAFVRVNPRRRIALAVLSRGHAASVVAARTFGAALPELFDLRMPSLLPRGAVLDSGRYEGCYQSGAFAVELACTGDELELRVHDRVQNSRRHVALVAAAGHTFFARSPSIEAFPFVQLVAARDEELRYLWNGRFVLTRR